MELHQLRYALAVQKHMSFTKAAEEIPVSVAAVSDAVRRLETELGVTLFARTNRTVRVTAAGALFFEHAVRSMASLDLAQRELAAYRGTRVSVALGDPPAAVTRGLPLLLARFHRERPMTEVKLIEASPKQLIELLRSGQLDLSFLTSPLGCLPADLEWFEIERQEIGVAITPTHPLASSDLIDLASVIDMQLVILSKGSTIREIAEEVCRRLGVLPKIAFETSVPAMMFGLVRAGAGFTLTSRARALQHGLAFSRCTPAPLDRVLVLAWSCTRTLSPESELLREKIRDSRSWLGG